MITCALLTTVSVVSFAQAAKTSVSMEPSRAPQATVANQAPGTTKTVERVAEERAKGHERLMGLTKEQYKGVYAAELEYAKEEAIAKPNGGPNPGQAYQWNMGRDQQIKKSVTAEQYAKYEASKLGSAK